jgi:hypothetical protein
MHSPDSATFLPGEQHEHVHDWKVRARTGRRSNPISVKKRYGKCKVFPERHMILSSSFVENFGAIFVETRPPPPFQAANLIFSNWR